MIGHSTFALQVCFGIAVAYLLVFLVVGVGQIMRWLVAVAVCVFFLSEAAYAAPRSKKISLLKTSRCVLEPVASAEGLTFRLVLPGSTGAKSTKACNPRKFSLAVKQATKRSPLTKRG
ncbi:MAG: hypothetical protein K1X79_12705 [Oligoflexia bacterium]|nr:hypothetical protein [Oligoflexia bacterium]